MQFIRGHLNRLAFATAIVASMAAYVPTASAQSVGVQGNQRIDAETIRGYFSGSDAASVNKGVKDLKASGLFSSVSTSRQGGRLIVIVRENTVINQVAFEGNSKVKAEQLQTMVNSKSRGPYNAATVQQDTQNIMETYRRSGRAAASVNSRIVDLPNGRVDVVFTIVEGDKTGVKTINFSGNQVYSSGKLVGLMETTEMNFMSFFKSTDIYDPDKIAADLERIRRYYLKNGYADFRVIGSDAQYDAAQKGYVINIQVEEGPQYIVGGINVDSRLAEIDGNSMRDLVRLSPGDVYDGNAVEKTVEVMTRAAARKGYAFSQVRPRGDRDPGSRTVNLGFIVEDGPRVYVEKINVRGNTRTRDYVVRREFDIGEGDAYNRVLIDRAERRLNNLGFFKKVKITNEPGSSADRVIVNVDVEDQSTGSFSISGGYSTTDGLVAEVSVSESNFLGRGQYIRLAATGGQRTRGVEFNFTEPYFMGYRLAAGFDLYSKQTDNSKYAYYKNTVTGGTIRFGLPITEEITFSPRYSLYQSRITIPNTTSQPYNDCSAPIVGYTPGTVGAGALSATNNCLTNGEASLALKESQGSTITSLVGYTLSYNTLDNVKNPTGGIYAEFRQDFAGVGGNSRFVRTTADARYYRELTDQVVGIARVQAGNIFGYGGRQLRVVDNFNLGPSLVRGFAPGGIGPRDASAGLDSQGNPLGGTTYVGASLEVQFPIFGLPKDLGLKGAVFADAGTLFGYKGKTNFGTGACVAQNVAPLYTQGSCIYDFAPGGTGKVGGDTTKIRSSVGASVLWQSPLGPIRFDFAKALTKDKADITQFFRFSGGTSF